MERDYLALYPQWELVLRLAKECSLRLGRECKLTEAYMLAGACMSVMECKLAVVQVEYGSAVACRWAMERAEYTSVAVRMACGLARMCG